MQTFNLMTHSPSFARMRSLLLGIVLLSISIKAFSQRINEGITAYESNDLQKATKVFALFKASASEYATAQYYLGRIAFDSNELNEAIEYFDEAIKSDQNNSNYHTWLGNAYGRLTQNSSKIRQGFIAPKIKNSYEKAIEIDPKNMDALWGLVEYYTQAPAFMGGSWEKAASTAELIKEVDLAESYRAYATIYLRQDKFDLAEEAYVKLAETDKNYQMSLGTFYQNYASYEKAFMVFEKVYKNDSTNLNALYQIGKTSALSGLKSDVGIDALTKYLSQPLIEGNPSYAGAKMRIAMIYEKTNQNEKAISFYESAIKDEPEMEEALAGLKRLK